MFFHVVYCGLEVEYRFHFNHVYLHFTCFVSHLESHLREELHKCVHFLQIEGQRVKKGNRKVETCIRFLK